MPYDITQTIWNLKCDANEFIYETDSQTREQTCGRMDWEFGMSRWKPLYRENNK